MADADDATSALIARLLASEYAYDAGANPYGDDADGGSDDGADDDRAGQSDDGGDYDPGGGGRARRRSGAHGGTARKRKGTSRHGADLRSAAAAAPAAPAAAAAASRPRRTDDTPAVADGAFAKGVWSSEEEARFLEALELHGRNWTQVVAHVRTRDANNIRSKAQKHFIKLFRAGAPLPAKVRESGDGYTLSGKPLDPNSAAARPYLRLAAPDQGQAPAADAGPAAAVTAKPAPKPRKSRRAAEAGEMAAPTSVAASAPALYVEPAEPQPVRERPRRNVRPAGSYMSSLGTGDAHEMYRCRAYAEPQQPFRVRVSPEALLVCDLHAHMHQSEVIGFLVGSWNEKTHDLSVDVAYPCRSKVAGPDNVEMDPEAEMAVRNEIYEQNRQIVGWYHSHPFFEPHPSRVDLENQRNFQKVFHDESADRDPFIGLIVGTFDPRLPSSQSVMSTFHIPPAAVEGGEPRALRVSIAVNAGWTLTSCLPALRRVVDFCASSGAPCTRMQERWRLDSDDNKLRKTLDSLRLRAVRWQHAAKRGQPAVLNGASGPDDDGAGAGAGAADEAPLELSAEDDAALKTLEQLISGSA